MEEKDTLFTIILSLIPFGLVYAYLGEKDKLLKVAISQALILILAGVSMFISSFLPIILYILFFSIWVWSIYDSVTSTL